MDRNSPLNYSKTQRIVLLIDLTPLLYLQNPNSYLTTLLSSAKTLLSFPPMSLSLSSFKLFFSSLSPLLSSSTLQKLPFCPSSYNPNSLSFNHPNQTLNSLSQTLNLISKLGMISIPGSVSVSGSRGVYTSSSVAQVIHDYAWDLCNNDGDSCGNLGDVLGVVRSNLVVLFSPVCRNFNDLSDFMGVVEDTGDDLIGYCDAFCEKFRGVFGYVRDAFVCRDIHFSWVDVRYELENDINRESYKLDDEYGMLVGLFRRGIKGLGWGFLSSDSIVLGSALVPFGLIYPMIGVSSIYCDFGDKCERVTGQLVFEILDVSGKPMECKCCDLQLVDLKALHGQSLNEFREHGKVGVDIGHQFTRIQEHFGNGVVKIDVKAVCRYSELIEVEEKISDVILVNELSINSKQNKKEPSREFFADRVLDMLSKETHRCMKKVSPPLWQILLSFLYRRGYWALVSLSKADGSTTMGVLKPSNIYSAFLCILKNNADFHSGTQCGLSGLNLGQCSSETGEKIGEFNIGMDSVSGMLGNDSKRKHKKPPVRYKDLSWCSFGKAAFELCEMELEEAYLSRGDTSKKFKFLKCWMKQIVKSSSSFLYKSNMSKAQARLSESHQESQQSLPSLVAENAVKEAPQRDVPAASLPEAAEAFFSNLSQRIQHGIESGVDSVAFAKRVVCSCIYWLSRKLGPHTNEESQASIEKSDGASCGGLVVRELIKIILVDPKDVSGKHNENDQSSKAPNLRSSEGSSEDKVREYELQILFRMEILQSEIAVGIREPTRHKFVKQICFYLELIQCSMDDGFFGDFNLNDYVGRTISCRYKQNLGSIVHSIYEQMDLLLFDDEDESPILLLNSEDSNQSWRMGDNDKGSEPNSTDDSFSGARRDHVGCDKNAAKSHHELKLFKAQERRERSLRRASFARRAMPELQRVWAPKLPKLSRSKSESFQRSKRKHRRESYVMVCETPMSGPNKCLFPLNFSDGDQECREEGDTSTGSIKRALFQNELFHDAWRP